MWKTLSIVLLTIRYFHRILRAEVLTIEYQMTKIQRPIYIRKATKCSYICVLSFVHIVNFINSGGP